MSAESQAVTEYMRSKAKVHGWTPAGAIDHIEAADLHDHTFRQWCGTVKDKLVPDLMRLMRDGRGEAQLKASLLLLYLDEPAGTDGVLACLQEDDPAFRLHTLSSLSTMPLLPLEEDAPAWREPPVPVKKEALFAALEPLLVTPGTRAGASAIEIALKLDLQQAKRHVLHQLKDGSSRVRSRILYWLARRDEDYGALDAAEELLGEDVETHSVVGSLETYCQGKEPQLAGRAAELLVNFVRANLDRPGNEITNHLWHALDEIVAAGHPEREQLLKEVLDGPVADWRRGVALRHLGTLEGEKGIKRLTKA